MKDKPLFDLENEFEISLISEVLTDQGIPFRIVLSSSTYWGITFGQGVSHMYGYAKLWGYTEDKEKIGEILEQVRASEPMDNADDLAEPLVDPDNPLDSECD